MGELAQILPVGYLVGCDVARRVIKSDLPAGVVEVTITSPSCKPVKKVDATGKVTGLKPGLVIVTAKTPDGKTDSVIIRVTA